MTPRNRNFVRMFPILVSLGLALWVASPALGQQQPAPAGSSTEVRNLPLTEVQRNSYVGDYRATAPDGEQVIFRIFVENGVLRGQPGGDTPATLLYQGENAFVPEGMSGIQLKFTMEGERASKFTFSQGSQFSIEAVRVN